MLGWPGGLETRAESRPVQSSTIAASTSPERTSCRPSAGSASRSSSDSLGWARSERASAGANATAADGNAVTTTRPDG